MTVYAVASRWPHRSFAATMQPYVALSSIVGATACLLAAPGSLPVLPRWMWASALVALAVGLISGNILSNFVSERTGRSVVIILGVIGAVSAIIAGWMALADH